MPEATKHNTTAAASRRTLLAAAPLAAVAAAMPAVTLRQMAQDRELIALCEHHAVSMERVNTCPYDIEDVNDPIYHEWDLTREAISAAKPQTLAGMAAKARAATREAMRPDGSTDFSDGRANMWAADLVGDILRLAGGAK